MILGDLPALQIRHITLTSNKSFQIRSIIAEHLFQKSPKIRIDHFPRISRLTQEMNNFGEFWRF